jgi:exosortase C (VPDSG-CTERM-specific)
MNASRDLADAGRSVTGSSPQILDAGSRRSPHLIRFCIFLLLLLAAFGRQLVLLIATSQSSELNSYIILIPFVSFYFLFVNRAQLARVYEPSMGWGTITLLVGMLVLTYLVKFSTPDTLSSTDRLCLITFAFVCLLWSGGFFFLGRQWMASAAFPIFFLIFFVPLPDRVVAWMETGLQQASADAANLFFAITGTPSHRTGTIFELPGITIQVAQECSGIRSSWILFITSIIAAQMFLTKTWSRIVLVAAVIPLGIIRNGFRIMVIGLLCIDVDPDIINSSFHHKGGPIFFTLSLPFLFLILWFLRRREVTPKTGAVRSGKDV